MSRFFYLLLALCTVLVAGMILVFEPAVAGPDDTTIDCTVPNNVVCDIADPDGIQHVQVALQTAQGLVIAVDETYSCQTEVMVSWDPIVPNAEFLVEDCSSSGPFTLTPAYFAGLLHWSLGISDLNISPAALLVRGFDPAGDSGVAIELGAASRWEALLQPQAGPGVALKADVFVPGESTPASTLSLVDGTAGTTLTPYLGAATYRSGTVPINPSVAVRLVGRGTLIDEPVVEPDPGRDPGGGVVDPSEPPPGQVPFGQQALRVFNTATLNEFEVVIEEDLLNRIHTLREAQGQTSASMGVGNPGGVEWLGGLATVGGLEPGGASPFGWSGGVDNRVKLLNTTYWPWRTIVHFGNSCSGALIGPRHILTAAHCRNQRGTNNWYTFTATPGRNGDQKPYGDSQMNPNPQPGDPFRWYYTPAQWRDPQYNQTNCPDPCYAATEWDWGLIIIPDYLGYWTGWMGYVARPGSQLSQVSHFNRGYPACGSKPNVPGDCEPTMPRLYGDTQTCTMGNYLFPGPDGWNRVIRNSCDISGGRSGSPVYHYFYDTNLGKWVPVAAMVEVWEHCYTCSSSDTHPNSARRITPADLGVISFFRQWKP